MYGIVINGIHTITITIINMNILDSSVNHGNSTRKYLCNGSNKECSTASSSAIIKEATGATSTVVMVDDG